MCAVSGRAILCEQALLLLLLPGLLSVVVCMCGVCVAEDVPQGEGDPTYYYYYYDDYYYCYYYCYYYYYHYSTTH